MKQCIVVVSILILCSNVITSQLNAQTITDSGVVVITAQVNSVVTTNPSSGSGGGGGGGGTTDTTSPTTVTLEGMAYPNAKIVILRGSVIKVKTVADPSAHFSVSLTNIPTGVSSFSVYSEDVVGRTSLVYTFPILITSGATINIGGIFLSPTIAVDKQQVKSGDPLRIFGYGFPKTDVNISVHSSVERTAKVVSDKNGFYTYQLDTTGLEYGKHQAESVVVTDDMISPRSIPAYFTVSDKETILTENGTCVHQGDTNCDNKVNLIDFSIMAYWFKRPGAPTVIDLNKDGIVSLIDFSIMAYHWTG